MNISRRTLAKNLAVSGAAASLSHLLRAESPEAFSDSRVPSASPSLWADWQLVHPGVWRATIGTPESFTPVSSRLVAPLVDGFRQLPSVDRPPMPRLTGSCSRRGCKVQLPLRPEEQVFGLGLQLLSFMQRGKKKVVRVNADPKLDTGDSHAPVPFYVTTAGLGILVDTARYASFYFGNARKRPTQTGDLTSSSSPDPNYTKTLEDTDASEVIIEIPSAGGVDVYLFAGPTMLDAVRRYNVFSGGGPVPPEWGLGFWYRSDARATAESALKFAKELREHKIPCDVLGLEPGWQSHAYSCTFAWNHESFPDPASFVNAAQKMQYKLNLWEHAYTNPASPIFSDLLPHSGDYGVWGGLVPDFAAQPAREVFGAYHGKTLIDLGISGFKLDECDSDNIGGWSFPECSSFPSGIDGEQMHNVFGLRYQMAIWDQFRKRQQPTFNLVRSSGALATPYPFVLYSDLYKHRDFIRALANSGFSGLLWCPEVRDASSAEDLIRRLQSVVFSPLAMINGWYIKNPPWKQLNRKLNNNDQFMDNWEKLEAQCREIIGWRMQLVPYLATAFQRYATDGTPPFRALVLDNPSDKRMHTVDDQYMVGDRMMVAPLFAGEPSRKVVLPEGGWHDFWTGEALRGGTEITVPASTEQIPVYVKTGSLLPWADVGLYAGSPESRRITARIYGDGSLACQVAADKGSYRLQWNQGSGKVVGDSGEYNIYAWKKIG
jgi:alpha-D-xyloside xylohydrolase